ncbi:hypothetical protein ACOSQ3_027490 [Xanthoceras sorbifolium]
MFNVHATFRCCSLELGKCCRDYMSLKHLWDNVKMETAGSSYKIGENFTQEVPIPWSNKVRSIQGEVGEGAQSGEDEAQIFLPGAHHVGSNVDESEGLYDVNREGEGELMVISNLRLVNFLEVSVILDRYNSNPNIPAHFQRFFLSFYAQKMGYLEGCRPFIGLDGCHLKGQLEVEFGFLHFCMSMWVLWFPSTEGTTSTQASQPLSLLKEFKLFNHLNHLSHLKNMNTDSSEGSLN